MRWIDMDATTRLTEDLIRIAAFGATGRMAVGVDGRWNADVAAGRDIDISARHPFASLGSLALDLRVRSVTLFRPSLPNSQ
jgi:hypothetical protein